MKSTTMAGKFSFLDWFGKNFEWNEVTDEDLELIKKAPKQFLSVVKHSIKTYDGVDPPPARPNAKKMRSINPKSGLSVDYLSTLASPISLVAERGLEKTLEILGMAKWVPRLYEDFFSEYYGVVTPKNKNAIAKINGLVKTLTARIMEDRITSLSRSEFITFMETVREIVDPGSLAYFRSGNKIDDSKASISKKKNLAIK